MKYMLHVTVYALCHVVDTTLIFTLVIVLQCPGFSWEDTTWCLNVACCLSLPQKKKILSINVIVNDVWVETFTTERVANVEKT